MGGRAIITADHGNSEQMYDADGSPFTAHTTNPVPVILVDDSRKDVTLRTGGRLSDLAPTMLELMGPSHSPGDDRQEPAGRLKYQKNQKKF